MRGEPQNRPAYVAANVVTKDGDIKYHLIPAGWVQAVLVAFGFLLLLAVVLVGLVLYNRLDLNMLDERMKVHENVTNTPNTNR